MDPQETARTHFLRCLQHLIDYENDREAGCVLHDAERRPFEPERRTLYLVTRSLVTDPAGHPDPLRKIHDLAYAAATTGPDFMGGSGFDFFLTGADDYLHTMAPQAYSSRGLFEAARAEQHRRFEAGLDKP